MQNFKFPTAFTILFGLILFACGLTWFVPAGEYSQTFNHTLGKNVAKPGTYKSIESKPQGIFAAFQAPIGGFYDAKSGEVRAIDVALFVLIIGGFLGVVNKTGAINSSIQAAMLKLQGREKWMIPILMTLFATGGTLYGMAEETLPFYLLIIPIVLAAGYDTITATAIILLGSGVGTLGSTINPFATVLASNAANVAFTQGIQTRLVLLLGSWLLATIYTAHYAAKVKAKPQNSLVYSTMRQDKRYFLKKFSEGQEYEFSNTHKLILLIFIASFITMVVGVALYDWWMEQMSALFIMTSLIIGFIAKMPEQEFVQTFIDGAKDLLSVALIIGLARGIVVVLDNANISATILHWAEIGVSGLSSTGFIMAIFLSLLLLSILVPSSSALAMLALPIMAPLADFSSVGRDLVVTIYQSANGLVNLINPTFAVVMGGLTIARVPYEKWFKFMWPLMLMLLVFIISVLLLAS